MTRTLLVPCLVSALVIADFIAAKAQTHAKPSDMEPHDVIDGDLRERVAALRRLVLQGAARPAKPGSDNYAPRSSAFG